MVKIEFIIDFKFAIGKYISYIPNSTCYCYSLSPTLSVGVVPKNIQLTVVKTSSFFVESTAVEARSSQCFGSNGKTEQQQHGPSNDSERLLLLFSHFLPLSLSFFVSYIFHILSIIIIIIHHYVFLSRWIYFLVNAISASLSLSLSRFHSPRFFSQSRRRFQPVRADIRHYTTYIATYTICRRSLMLGAKWKNTRASKLTQSSSCCSPGRRIPVVCDCRRFV